MNNPISIIIPTRDRETIFKTTYENLVNQLTEIDYELIVVNDSTMPFSKSIELLIKLNRKAKIIESNGRGVAYARNKGVQESAFETVLFIDDDILLNEKNIKYLIDFKRKNPKTILMLNWEYTDQINKSINKTKFGRYLYANQLNSFKGYRSKLKWENDAIFEVEAIANFLILIDKKIFLDAGGYNETFPFAGGEDTELSIRLSRMGIKYYIDPQTTVYHNETDRLELRNWLTRKERSGMTLKTLEHLELANTKINYSTTKHFVLRTVETFQIVIMLFIHLIPNKRFFDKVTFKVFDMLVAASIYKGYRQNSGK